MESVVYVIRDNQLRVARQIPGLQIQKLQSTEGYESRVRPHPHMHNFWSHPKRHAGGPIEAVTQNISEVVQFN